MIRIYRIYDESDANYEPWYGTSKDIIKYLEEDVESNDKFNANSHFEVNLELYGLVAEVVYAFDKADFIALLLQQLYDKDTLIEYEAKSILHTIKIMKYSKMLNW